MRTKNLLINLGLIGSLLFCLAFACNNGDERGGTTGDGTTSRKITRDATTDDETTTPMETDAGVGAKYAARDPRTCADTKSPTNGAISAAQATKYIICNQEREFGDNLYLVENVKVTIGGSRPYSYGSDSRSSDIDTTAQVYPIRGSFDKYQCSKVSDFMENKGKNCTLYHEPKGEGKCYKTTFGDWYCNMEDYDNNRSNTEYNLAPPK